MSQDLALREGALPVALTSEQLSFISRTEFVPAALRGNMPAILACVATGRAIGIPDMTALRSIHIVDGKATFSAELMVQLVRRAGHSIVGDVTDSSVTITGKRADNGDTMNVTWTLEMAERAGLLSKTNWKKYPEAMLWARAASQLCRMLFADCFAGATYTPEEIDVNDVTGDELLDEPVAESVEAVEVVEETAAGLSAHALKKLIADAAVPAERVAEVARSLFPAVASARGLSDVQRAELWAALNTAEQTSYFADRVPDLRPDETIA